MVVDRIGREITNGCFIAYGHLLDRSAGIRLGRVESVNEKKNKGNGYSDGTTLTVLGINQDWGGSAKKDHLLEKRSTLLFPDRTIVLDTLPAPILELFEKDCLGLGKNHKWVKHQQYYKKCTVCGRDTSRW